MATKKTAASKQAKHGEKMIEVKIRFWTNDIAPGDGNIAPKHAWTSGVVRIESNPSHGIVASKPMPFRSLLHLTSVIEKVLIAHGITLHPSNQMKRYFEDEG
jgi:hypothetical protein